jgi:hypothetical protein
MLLCLHGGPGYEHTADNTDLQGPAGALFVSGNVFCASLYDIFGYQRANYSKMQSHICHRTHFHRHSDESGRVTFYVTITRYTASILYA